MTVGIWFCCIASMHFVPSRLFLAKGVGTHKHELRSFEMALRDHLYSLTRDELVRGLKVGVAGNNVAQGTRHGV